jgi:hypothetical protein
MLLLAYNGKSWLTMADRRGAGRDPASEKLQQAGYFGDSDCFLSFHWNLDEANFTPAAVLLKPSLRTNGSFMFLVDEGLRIGNLRLEPSIGMGGPRDRQAWIVDEDLEHCRIYLRCSTFSAGSSDGGLSLKIGEGVVACRVLSLEVYALDDRLCPPEVRRELSRKAIVRSYVQDVYGGTERGEKPHRSVLDGNEALAIKGILSLGGAHEFHEEGPLECCRK